MTSTASVTPADHGWRYSISGIKCYYRNEATCRHSVSAGFKGVGRCRWQPEERRKKWPTILRTKLPIHARHNCGSCSASCGERTAPSKLAPNSVSSFKKVIGVVSGKGGVGKTSVTCLLASELMRAGKKVGIMDADVTGPSIPKAFGAKGPLCARSKRHESWHWR